MDLQPPVWGEDDEPDVEDAFGAHDIEYWVWSGRKLVPASPAQAAQLREREALLRLERWRAAQANAAPAAERSRQPRAVARLVRALRFRRAALPAGPGGDGAQPAGATLPARKPGARQSPSQTHRTAAKS